METPILRVRDLSLEYGKPADHGILGILSRLIPASTSSSPCKHRALRSLSFDVMAGEILVIMGLSGSGKSSLLRCFNGLNGTGHGQGTLHGEIHLHAPPQDLALHKLDRKGWHLVRSQLIAMVFQQANLMPWRTVGENIAFPLELQHRPADEVRSRVATQLERVKLSAWCDRYPHELSGGMQQRVGLARALITDSPILLMDEPFSALDPLLRRQLQMDLLELNRTLRKTILFVSHDREEALRLGRRIGIMKDGSLLQMGTPQQLLDAPEHPAVRDFLEDSPPSHTLISHQPEAVGIIQGFSSVSQLEGV